MVAIKAVVKNGLIKPLEAIDLPEDKEIVVYIPEKNRKQKNIQIGLMKNGKDSAFIVL